MLRLTLVLILLCPQTALCTEKLTLAILGDGLKQLQTSQFEASAKKAGYTLVESELALAIARGLELPELFNLSLREAASLGAAIGVDGYVLIRLRSFERIGEKGKLYAEAFLAVALVVSRSGRLIDFQFYESQGRNTEESTDILIKQAVEALPNLLNRLYAGYLEQFQPPQIDPKDAVTTQPITQPEVLERSRPSYSEIAQKMQYTARVELEVVLRSDGSVGRVSVIRWAGHGLDEAATEAIRRLRFRPATVQNRPVNCQVSIVYNFNYIRK